MAQSKIQQQGVPTKKGGKSFPDTPWDMPAYIDPPNHPNVGVWDWMIWFQDPHTGNLAGSLAGRTQLYRSPSFTSLQQLQEQNSWRVVDGPQPSYPVSAMDNLQNLFVGSGDTPSFTRTCRKLG